MLKIPLFPIIFALYPIAFIFSVNQSDVSFTQALIPAAASIALSALAFAIIRYYIERDFARSCFITSLFTIMFFSYGHVENLVSKYFTALDDVSLFFLWGIVLAAAVSWLKKASFDPVPAVAALNVMSVVLIIFPVLSIISYNIEGRGGPQPETAPAGAEFISKKKELPDIYYIILDEYGRSDVLRTMYDYDDSDFIKALETKGFYVASRSRSNYCYTDLSVTSALNMDYLDEVITRHGLASGDNRAVMQKYLWDNKVFKILRKNGYKIITFDSGEGYTSITGCDGYISPAGTKFFNGPFRDMALKLTPVPALLKIFRLKGDAVYGAFEAKRKTALYSFEKLAEIQREGGPYFIFCLINTPHPPFVFGRNGEAVNIEKYKITGIDRFAIMDERDRANYIRDYKNQAIFTAKKAVETVDGILKNSKRPPVIILQGDHGPASTFEFEKAPETNGPYTERFSILNAYYAPGPERPAFYEAITPVNSFRLILKNYLGLDMPLLKDEIYHSTWLLPYKLKKVSF